VSNGEIRIGNTAPYIGPVAAYSAAAQTIGAYFSMVNENGGVNGRRLKWLSEDDGYSPPRTLQQTRKLVESDDVLLMTSVLGTATNVAIRQYLNSKGVPHLFPNSGSSQWNNPEQFKWTVPSLGRPDQEAEGEVYARFLVAKD
ncbi:ABC transporter substrate-binding protein, partial [Rhizobiaceae sp. 2RAB30]